MNLSPGSQYIHSPRFIDADHKFVRGIVRLQNGTWKEFEGHIDETNNPFIRDLKILYTTEEIERNTERENLFSQKKEEIEKRLQEDEIRDEGLRILAKAKADALRMEVFLNESNKEIKRRIRRAESVFEVTALSAAAYLSEIQNNEENTHYKQGN